MATLAAHTYTYEILVYAVMPFKPYCIDGLRIIPIAAAHLVMLCNLKRDQL